MTVYNVIRGQFKLVTKFLLKCNARSADSPMAGRGVEPGASGTPSPPSDDLTALIHATRQTPFRRNAAFADKVTLSDATAELKEIAASGLGRSTPTPAKPTCHLPCPRTRFVAVPLAAARGRFVGPVQPQ